MSVSKGNLLIIDDEGARARVLADRLSVHGFDSQIVTDVANTAYSLGWDSDVDVILCELELKNFSWESARLALRTMDVQVPVIMLCGTAEVEPMMNAVDPAQSPPRALLKAGLALKSLSQRQTTTTAATAYAEPAVGMLSTAAGEQCQRNPRVSFGLALPSLTRTAR